MPSYFSRRRLGSWSRSLPRNHPGIRRLAVEQLEERRLLAIFAVDSASDAVDVFPGDGIAILLCQDGYYIFITF